jgi:hypothetical protein
MATAFNGTTVAIGAAGQTPLTSARYKSSVAKVKVSGSGNALKTYVAGVKDRTATIELVGGTSLAVGSEGHVTITWGGSGALSMSNCVVVSKKITGSEDSPISTTLELVPIEAS